MDIGAPAKLPVAKLLNEGTDDIEIQIQKLQRECEQNENEHISNRDKLKQYTEKIVSRVKPAMRKDKLIRKYTQVNSNKDTGNEPPPVFDIANIQPSINSNEGVQQQNLMGEMSYAGASHNFLKNSFTTSEDTNGKDSNDDGLDNDNPLSVRNTMYRNSSNRCSWLRSRYVICLILVVVLLFGAMIVSIVSSDERTIIDEDSSISIENTVDDAEHAHEDTFVEETKSMTTIPAVDTHSTVTQEPNTILVNNLRLALVGLPELPTSIQLSAWENATASYFYSYWLQAEAFDKYAHEMVVVSNVETRYRVTSLNPSPASRRKKRLLLKGMQNKLYSHSPYLLTFNQVVQYSSNLEDVDIKKMLRLPFEGSTSKNYVAYLKSLHPDLFQDLDWATDIMLPVPFEMNEVVDDSKTLSLHLSSGDDPSVVVGELMEISPYVKDTSK